MMTKSMMVIAIIGLSVIITSAQVNSAPRSPVKDFLLTRGAPTETRVPVAGGIEPTANGTEIPSAELSTNNHPGAVQVNAVPGFNQARSDGSNSPRIAITTIPTNAPLTTRVGVVSASLSQEYRVGVGDVLDVQLTDMPTKKSTLFTVREGGTLDYPLAWQPITVTGLTADEIAIRLRGQIKVLENPRMVVKVRDYFSHRVVISGLVAAPGAKFLRREAIPLYVVLVEAQPQTEAINATIMRTGQSLINVDLMDHNAAATLVLPGDVVTVFGLPNEFAGFIYAGGAISSPGQKIFYAGLTLTQAILACGGVTHDGGRTVKISRQGVDGRLITAEYNLQQIQDGMTADPVLQRGDRITVPESR